MFRWKCASLRSAQLGQVEWDRRGPPRPELARDLGALVHERHEAPLGLAAVRICEQFRYQREVDAVHVRAELGRARERGARDSILHQVSERRLVR